MKMGCSFFIGLFFILIGLEIILRAFFGIHLPIFRTFIALFFIYIGIRIFIGRPLFGYVRCCDGNNAAFGSFTQSFKDREISHEDISTVFGKKTIDLTDVKIKGEKAKLKVNCIFGDTEIILDKNTQFKIAGNSAFGSMLFPESDTFVFGSRNYESPGFKPSEPYLDINANVVFGSIRIK